MVISEYSLTNKHDNKHDNKDVSDNKDLIPLVVMLIYGTQVHNALYPKSVSVDVPYTCPEIEHYAQ